MPMLEVGGNPGSKCQRSKVEEQGEGEVSDWLSGAVIGHVALQSQTR